MNRILFLAIAIALSTNCLAQQEVIKPAKGTYQYHYQKQRSNRTAGWLLLTGGLVLGATGVGIDLGNIFEPGKEDDKTGQIVSYTGIAAMLGSIPCFIASGKHKRKALELKAQPTATLQPMKFRSIPSLTFTMKL